MVNNMTPTYLYIKQHTITGKLYFGKTTRKNVEKYTGSGKYWKSHINKYGKEHIHTLWYCLYYDKEILNEAAISFSKLWDIVNSEKWLNLIDENGINGGTVKGWMPQKSRESIANHTRIRFLSDNPAKRPEVRKKLSTAKQKENNPNFGKSDCADHLNKTKLKCEFCNYISSYANIKSNHGKGKCYIFADVYNIKTKETLENINLKDWCTQNNYGFMYVKRIMRTSGKLVNFIIKEKNEY